VFATVKKSSCLTLFPSLAHRAAREFAHGNRAQIITRLLKLLTRQGYLIEEQGMRYLAEVDTDRALTPLQAASCTYRIALGPRAGQKVLSLQKESISGLCANAHGFQPARWGALWRRSTPATRTPVPLHHASSDCQ
jgi:hypothetical protein